MAASSMLDGFAGRVRVLDEGAPRSDRMPVVLLHGLLTTASAWDEAVPVIAATRRVVIPELPGHGGSAAASRDVTLADLVGDLLAVLDGCGIARAFVLGTSLGGLVALHTAIAAPHRVAGLGLFATPLLPETDATRRRRLGTLHALERLGVRPVLRSMAGWMFSARTRRHAPHVVERWLASIESASPIAIRRTAAAALFRDDAVPLLCRVGVPALVVGGHDDALLDPSQPNLAARSIREATLHWIADAGHFLPIEQGPVLGETIRGWLETHDAS